MAKHIVFKIIDACLELNCMHKQHVAYLPSFIGVHKSSFKFKCSSKFKSNLIRVLLEYYWTDG